MTQQANAKDEVKPHIYQELAELVSSVGDDVFLNNMHRFINTSLTVSRVELSEWTVDDSQATVSDVKLLGHADTELNPQMQTVCPTRARHRNDHPLVKRVLEVEDDLLIHLNARMKNEKGHDCLGTSHQCCMISRKANRCCVISLHRLQDDKDYSLQELSVLKCLSATLLPLSERHARAHRQSRVKRGGGPLSHRTVYFEDQLQHDFNERLRACDVSLSAREKEVCLMFLAGSAVADIAEQLYIKSSSVETYLKRSAVKLGISGRHGLTKWLLCAEWRSPDA
ncbi:helix-turn-helix transcriptional regulator [Pseudomonas syringae]|uniref:Transcriptional regulator LuxR n=1 Tax=Pseudomonas syringae pv. syringae TaxID=321 RepID=A0A1S6YB59_PSESY|nr:helix-turn-helix transcriptional regulator [Pseudomonas syringae]ALE01130.1 LuxR family transcriptional regulator [Pseudomonas syringae UMAF0158]AQX42070.1 Transcriptional regulator LuxR [Pseudomonas syringae pv. syringae]AQX42135.1 Transcriptional regulator LuxR [Pseudomonas syringae pv. syringae]MCK9694743.1 helix-turn-helix transcriptional regulator [Pseudomonas syringae pv. syringae]MCK9709774.1 helix-turn-helix transcriptional regulator [Pseudomonas syringae pv. syringae]